MWVLFSVITVLLWGTSETIFKSVSNNEKNTVLKLIACNGIMMGIIAVIFMLVTRTKFDFSMILTYLPIAVMYIASMFCTYKAMRYVKISILSPVQNSSCAIVTLLCVIVLKQVLTWYQIIAILLILTGLILLSINKDETKLLDLPEGEEKISKAAAYKLYLTGFMFAFGYLILDGIAGFMDDYTLESNLSAEQLNIAYSFIYFVVGIIAYIYLKATKKIDKLFDFKNDKKKLIGTLIETAGQYTYIYAFAFGDAALASPFIAAYSIVTVILSRIFLKEKLHIRQYAMIIMVMIGMIVLSVEVENEVEDTEEVQLENDTEIIEELDAKLDYNDVLGEYAFECNWDSRLHIKSLINEMKT